MEVKVRRDKRFNCNEPNVNLCSDQRALQWSQEGKTDPAEDVRSFHTFITVWKWATQTLAFMFLK